MERVHGSVGYPGEFRGLLRFVIVHQVSRGVIFLSHRPDVRWLTGHLSGNSAIHLKQLRGNAMKNQNQDHLSVDTLILAIAGIWFVSVIINLVV
jgi:hypothetical protein